MRGQTIIGVRIHERETPLHSWRSRELLHEVHEDQYPEIVKSELVNIRLTEDNQPLVMIESFCEFYPYRETED